MSEAIKTNEDALREWAAKKMQEEQAVSRREEVLKRQLDNDPTFKLFYDNGMKDLIESDKSILDSDQAIKMAMQATKNRMELEEIRKSKEAEVKQEEVAPSTGPATQSVPSPQEPSVDVYEQPIGSFKDMNINNFKNLSQVGKLNAQLLKG